MLGGLTLMITFAIAYPYSWTINANSINTGDRDITKILTAVAGWAATVFCVLSTRRNGF